MKCNGPKIRELRKEKDWSIEALAASAGVNYRTVHRSETQSKCSKDTLARLALALDVEPTELIIEENRKLPIEHSESIVEKEAEQLNGLLESNQESNLDRQDVSLEDIAIVKRIYEQLKIAQESKAIPSYDVDAALHKSINQTGQWITDGLLDNVDLEIRELLKGYGIIRTPLIGKVGDIRIGMFVEGISEISNVYMSVVDDNLSVGYATRIYSRWNDFPDLSQYPAFDFCYVNFNNSSKNVKRTIIPKWNSVSRLRFRCEYLSDRFNIGTAIVNATYQGEPNFEPYYSQSSNHWSGSLKIQNLKGNIEIPFLITWHYSKIKLQRVYKKKIEGHFPSISLVTGSKNEYAQKFVDFLAPEIAIKRRCRITESPLDWIAGEYTVKNIGLEDVQDFEVFK